MEYYFDDTFKIYPVNNFTAFMTLNESTAKTKIDLIWNDEDIYGRSKTLLCISKIYASYYLAALITLEKNIGANITDAYYEAKYDLDSVRESLACINLDWDEIMSSVIPIGASTRYFGTLATTNPSNVQIKSLSSDTSTIKDKTWYQDGNGEFIYYCYPQSFGTALFYMGGFRNSAWTLIGQSIDGVMYNVYRKNNIQNGVDILIKAD